MIDKSGGLRFGTRVIHGGQQPDPLTGAVMTPIYATSTYVQSSPGVHKGYDYTRTRNPTRDALQAAMANLEGGAAAFTFASGMAATATVLELLDARSHIIAMHDLYGGSYRILENVRKRSAGHEVSFVDLTSLDALESAIRPNTRLVWVETPTNPLLKIVDLRAVAEIARRHGLMSVCDNTFATPYVQRPLEAGFDIVVHSTTKYLNGHSDALGGAAVVREDKSLQDRLWRWRVSWRVTPRWSASTIPGWKAIRSMRWPNARCRAVTAVSSRRPCAARWKTRAKCWRNAICSPSPRAWVASRASSSTRR